jgi:hypothetical protein
MVGGWRRLVIQGSAGARCIIGRAGLQHQKIVDAQALPTRHRELENQSLQTGAGLGREDEGGINGGDALQVVLIRLLRTWDTWKNARSMLA